MLCRTIFISMMSTEWNQGIPMIVVQLCKRQKSTAVATIDSNEPMAERLAGNAIKGPRQPLNAPLTVVRNDPIPIQSIQSVILNYDLKHIQTKFVSIPIFNGLLYRKISTLRTQFYQRIAKILCVLDQQYLTLGFDC